MKNSASLPLLLAGLAAGATTSHATLAFTEHFPGVNLTIPDNSVLGAQDTRSVAIGSQPIVEVKVTLDVTGGFTGDLYAILSHDGASSVLLNRPGRRTADTLGYDDSGLTVTFSDAGSGGDVHNYRLSVTGSHTTALGVPLTGAWQPDGRTALPTAVLDTSPRTAFLSAFAGHLPDGNWTLFLADLSPVGQAVLNSWTLEITVVPEPAEIALAFGLGLLGWAAWRRR
jgi:subtilisin-like proprotein convertase family protein